MTGAGRVRVAPSRVLRRSGHGRIAMLTVMESVLLCVFGVMVRSALACVAPARPAGSTDFMATVRAH